MVTVSRRIQGRMAIVGFFFLNAISAIAIFVSGSDRFTTQAQVFNLNGTVMNDYSLFFECWRVNKGCTFCFYGELPENNATRVCELGEPASNFCPFLYRRETTDFQDFANRNTPQEVFFCFQSLPGPNDDVNIRYSQLESLESLSIFLIFQIPVLILFGMTSFAELYVELYGDYSSRLEMGFLEIFSDVSWMLLIYQFLILRVECLRNIGIQMQFENGTTATRLESTFVMLLILQFFIDPAIVLCEIVYGIQTRRDLGFPRNEIVRPFRKSRFWTSFSRFCCFIMSPLLLITRIYAFLMWTWLWPVSRVIMCPFYPILDKETFVKNRARILHYGVILGPTVVVFVATLNSYFLSECRTSRDEVSFATRLVEFGLPVAFLLLNPAIKAIIFREDLQGNKLNKNSEVPLTPTY